MTRTRTEQLQTSDHHFLHPWEDMDNLGKQQRTVIAQGDGVYVHDSEGNRLLDGPGGMWCVNIGHRRKEMADVVANQIMALTYVSPWSMTNEPAVELARKLAEISPGDLNHVFFTTGGSTAVDSALRFIMFYHNVLGRPDKKQVIAHQKAYHGSTYLSASASGKARDKSYLDLKTDTIHHIPVPSRHAPDRMIKEGLAGALERKIQEIGPDRVAAFITEPIQASGGVILAPDGYQAACLAVCRKYDVLYISDEVVTGFGRLGHFFASEAVFDIQPDIITCAKGITSGYVPLGAFLVSDRLLHAIQTAGTHASFSNGFTYSGHPVACAAALKNIEIMEREDLLQHVREIAPYFQQQLQSLRDLPGVVDVRGMGLMGCVECDINKDRKQELSLDYEIGNRIDAHCQTLGLLVRPLINMCVMSPPLIITERQIDELVSKLRQGIALAMRDAERDGLWCNGAHNESAVKTP